MCRNVQKRARLTYVIEKEPKMPKTKLIQCVALIFFLFSLADDTEQVQPGSKCDSSSSCGISIRMFLDAAFLLLNNVQ